ncbi:MAG: agmatine deiminase family protein [Oscillospiraceae bacterium]|nr:agmatine deiminase family protein [Oscillospiraceae bacterium]
MIYFSSLLKTDPKYKPAADRIFVALDSCGIKYDFIEGAKSIWVRDFMPAKTKSGKYVSFRYEPSYLDDLPELRTKFKEDLLGKAIDVQDVIYSDINLDGGNFVFSPSREKVIISDRIFSENPAREADELLSVLRNLLEAQVTIISSCEYDMTGHADGMVRFVDENTIVTTFNFPYFDPGDPAGISAVGSYINFLETERHIFLPVFGIDTDDEAIAATERIYKNKTVVPVNVKEIAVEGGGLNCISWEM